jgi:hypothetical protein
VPYTTLEFTAGSLKNLNLFAIIGLSTWFYVFELNPLIFFGIKMDIAL